MGGTMKLAAKNNWLWLSVSGQNKAYNTAGHIDEVSVDLLNNYQYLILVLVINFEMVLCKGPNVRFHISKNPIK